MVKRTDTLRNGRECRETPSTTEGKLLTPRTRIRHVYRPGGSASVPGPSRATPVFDSGLQEGRGDKETGRRGRGRQGAVAVRLQWTVEGPPLLLCGLGVQPQEVTTPGPHEVVALEVEVLPVVDTH